MTELNYLEKEFFRQKDLNKSKASSDKVFEKAESDYKTMKVNIRSMAEKLQMIGINPTKLNEGNISKSIALFSPIDGYVADVPVNVGKYLQPEDVIFELVNPEDIHLGLTVFEKDLDKLYIGQKVIAYNNSNPEKQHHCEIILIGKNISKDRSLEVHCHFDDYDKQLIPGMFMNAEIETQENEVFALPQEAVVEFEGVHYIFLAKKNNQFIMQAIKAGVSQNGFTEVTLPHHLLNTKFAVKGAYNLLMMLKNTEEE